MPAAPRGRFLNPYASLVDLRRPSGLGDTPVPPAPSRLTQKALDKAAKSLGIQLPRPKDMTPREEQVWRILAGVDVASARLARAYDNMLQTLAISGAAVCADLRQYNVAAMRVFAVQRSALEALKQADLKGLPEAVPTPNLFLGMGADRLPETDGFIRCDTNQPLIMAAPPDNSSGVRVMFRSPAICPPEGGLSSPLLPGIIAPAAASNPVGWTVLGVYAIVALGGVLAIRYLSRAWQGVDKYDSLMETALIESEYNQFRSKAIKDLTAMCLEHLAPGQEPWRCTLEADKTAPKGLGSIKALQALAESEKRGVLWYLGAGVVVLAVGYGVWRWRSSKKSNSEE